MIMWYPLCPRGYKIFFMRTLGRMTTSIERVFRRTPEGYYREIWLHFITFLNDDGSIKSSKLDTERHGGLWKMAREGERSSYGEVSHLFPETDKPVRLVCIGKPHQ